MKISDLHSELFSHYLKEGNDERTAFSKATESCSIYFEEFCKLIIRTDEDSNLDFFMFDMEHYYEIIKDFALKSDYPCTTLEANRIAHDIVMALLDTDINLYDDDHYTINGQSINEFINLRPDVHEEQIKRYKDYASFFEDIKVKKILESVRKYNIKNFGEKDF